MHYQRWSRNGDPQKQIRIRGTVEDRFRAYVNSSDASGCHIWTAGLNGGGYGVATAGNGRRQLAHRVAYESAYGEIAEGLVIDHICGNHACVNPAHLRACSQKQNLENLRSAYRGNRSGVRGVTWHGQAGRWRAQVMHNGRDYHIGLYADIAEAEIAVIAKRNELFTHNDADRA